MTWVHFFYNKDDLGFVIFCGANNYLGLIYLCRVIINKPFNVNFLSSDLSQSLIDKARQFVMTSPSIMALGNATLSFS